MEDKIEVGEYAKISLDRYDDFLDDNRKANLLYWVKKELMQILDDGEFNKNDYIHSQVLKIYERLCEEI